MMSLTNRAVSRINAAKVALYNQLHASLEWINKVVGAAAAEIDGFARM
jgi:hypothetical protein